MSTNRVIYIVLLMGLTTLVMASIFSSYLNFRDAREFSRTLLLLEPIVTSEVLSITDTTLQFKEGTIDISRNVLIVRDAEIMLKVNLELNKIDQVELIRGVTSKIYPTNSLYEFILRAGKNSEVIYFVD